MLSRVLIFGFLVGVCLLLPHTGHADDTEVGGPSLELAGPVELRLVSGFLLVAPLLAWNVVFARRLPSAYERDSAVPHGLRILEHVLRVPTFIAPLLLPLGVGDPVVRAGWALYGVGASAYLASWLAQTHFADSRWSTSLAGRLAPAYTPLLWLLGIALIGRSWPYGLAASAFVVVHVTHFALVFGRRSG